MNYAVLEQISIAKTYPYRGLTIVKGSGVFLFDINDNAFLDLGSNYGINILGHGHPVFVQRINNQLNKLVNLHGSFSNDVRSEAAFRLKKLALKNLGEDYKIVFSSSGSESVDNAVKMALYLRSGKKILAFTGAYHGKTFLPLSLTYEEKYKKNMPRVFDKMIVRAEYNNLEDLEKKFNSEIGIVILELIQGDGGIIPAEKAFILRLKELVKKHNAILIIDEVQTGTGRTGKFFASEWYALQPDILLLGKGIAAGIPTSVILIRKYLAGKLFKGIQTSTFGGNPLSMQGILVALDLIDDKFLKNVQRTGEFLLQKLKKISSEDITAVRGLGLMLGVEVRESKRDLILKQLQKRQVIALPAAGNVIRFLPPLVLQKQDLRPYLENIKRSF